jgi:hypothetical protein
MFRGYAYFTREGGFPLDYIPFNINCESGGKMKSKMQNKERQPGEWSLPSRTFWPTGIERGAVQ